MAKVSEYFDFGNVQDNNFEELIRNLERMYTDLAVAVNSKPDVYQRETDGQISDTFLLNGDININLTTNKVEMLTNHDTQTSVVWTTLS